MSCGARLLPPPVVDSQPLPTRPVQLPPSSTLLAPPLSPLCLVLPRGTLPWPPGLAVSPTGPEESCTSLRTYTLMWWPVTPRAWRVSAVVDVGPAREMVECALVGLLQFGTACGRGGSLSVSVPAVPRCAPVPGRGVNDGCTTAHGCAQQPCAVLGPPTGVAAAASGRGAWWAACCRLALSPVSPFLCCFLPASWCALPGQQRG